MVQGQQVTGGRHVVLESIVERADMTRRASFTARPVALGAGASTARRLPPRVITMVSPRSALSSTEAKFRDASVAVIVFMNCFSQRI